MKYTTQLIRFLARALYNPKLSPEQHSGPCWEVLRSMVRIREDEDDYESSPEPILPSEV